MAGRDQPVIIAVAAPDGVATLPRKAREMLGGAAGEKLRRGGGQDRMVQGAAGAGRHRPAVDGRRLPPHHRPAFVRYVLVARYEERRVGEEWGGSGRGRWLMDQ